MNPSIVNRNKIIKKFNLEKKEFLLDLNQKDKKDKKDRNKDSKTGKEIKKNENKIRNF